MGQSSIKISAEVLFRNANKVSVRDLNAEFQRMGGQVIHKNSKHGSIYLLSHSNESYLEQFRIRLFKELGLSEELDVDSCTKMIAAPVQVPRYGDRHGLRRGWNVRSEKEIKDGITNDARIDPWKENRADLSNKRNISEPERSLTREPMDQLLTREVQKDEVEPYYEPLKGNTIRTFEERWGNIDKLMTIVRDALDAGAVDDGQVIKYAYTLGLSEVYMKRLKKQLWDSRCRGYRACCPYMKRRYRFEDVMRILHANVKGFQNIESPFGVFVESWAKNIESMYGPFLDNNVEVICKISSYKPHYQKGKEHVKLLLYDLKMNVRGETVVKDVRKIWARIDLSSYHDLTENMTLRLGDIIRIHGRCEMDPFYIQHMLTKITYVEIIRTGRGEALGVMR